MFTKVPDSGIGVVSTAKLAEIEVSLCVNASLASAGDTVKASNNVPGVYVPVKKTTRKSVV